MGDGRLDRWLAVHFETPPGVDRLDNLEGDVWRLIHARRAARGAWRWPPPPLAPRFRLAAVGLAIAVGLLAGGAPGGLTAGEASLQALDMQVFTARAGHLPSTVLAGRI